MRGALAVCLLLAGCGGGKSGTYVVVEMSGTTSGAIKSIVVEVGFDGRTATHTLDRPGGDIVLPARAAFEVDSGQGLATLTAIARGAGDVELARDSATVTVVRGDTVTATIRFGASLDGGVDAAVPDAEVVDATAAAELVIAPTSFGFPDTAAMAQSAEHTFVVRNQGGSATGAVQIGLAGIDATHFVITGGTCTGLPLAAGATCDVAVAFKPQAEGARTATLQASSTPGGGAFAVLTGATPPKLLVTPAAADFGAAPVNTLGGSASFTVRNSGGATTTALAVALTGEFDKVSDTCMGMTLAAAATCTIVIQFHPTGSAGARAGMLTITGSSMNAIAMLSGQATSGQLSGSPGSIAFGLGEVAADSGEISWTIRNNGGAATGMLALGMSGDSDMFPRSNGCSASLAPGASCTVAFHFHPLGIQAYSASFTMTATPGGTVSVNLTGTGGYRLTVNVTRVGAAQGRVVGLQLGFPFPFPDSNINCPGTCSEVHAAGAQVVLNSEISNGSNTFFGGWGGACAALGLQSRAACSLTMNSNLTVSATFKELTWNLAFVTSVDYPSNLGSAAAYSQRCNQLATTAGINNTGGNAFVAWVSDGTSSPSGLSATLPALSGFVRMDGRPVAGTLTDLLQNRLIHAISLTEAGTVAPVLVRTGTLSDGTRAPSRCNNWSDSTTGLMQTMGVSSSGPFNWTHLLDQTCDKTAPVYCLMTTKQATLPTPPSIPGAKLIYLSNTKYTPNSTTGPGSVCNPTMGDRALIALQNSNGIDGLDANATYVRPDGWPVGTRADLAADQLATGVWIRGDGSFFAESGAAVWVGSVGFNAPGTAGGTCAGWLSANDPGPPIIGRPNFASSVWSGSTLPWTCATPAYVYCYRP